MQELAINVVDPLDQRAFLIRDCARVANQSIVLDGVRNSDIKKFPAALTSLGVVHRLAALTVPKAGFGYYVPPIGGGEEAFCDPRETVCRDIVALDQVEAIKTSILAFHEDHDEQNNFRVLAAQNS